MTRYFYGNFDFEHALAGRCGISARAAQAAAELAASWICVAETGDLIWTPAAVEQEFSQSLARSGFPRVEFVTDPRRIPRGTELVPWGWTDSCRHEAARFGWRVVAPLQSVVRLVNSRRFSARLEQEWNVGLEGAVEVTSWDTLHSALNRLPNPDQGWVLKAEFGMSARERLLGHGRDVSSHELNWIRRRFRNGETLYLEPWVEREAEAGFQFTIRADGSVGLEGVTRLDCGPTGEYRGSRFDEDALARAAWEPAIAVAMHAAERVAAAGYFGPLGIDAMRYRDERGRVRYRPVQDINSRWTMGRLALGLRRLLPAGWKGAWLHVSAAKCGDASPDEWLAAMQSCIPAVRLVRTSSLHVGDRPSRHLAVALMSADTNALEKAIARISGRGGQDMSSRAASDAL